MTIVRFFNDTNIEIAVLSFKNEVAADGVQLYKHQ